MGNSITMNLGDNMTHNMTHSALYDTTRAPSYCVEFDTISDARVDQTPPDTVYDSYPLIFGTMTKEKMSFLEGILYCEDNWEDICINMIRDNYTRDPKYDIGSFPVLTEKIAQAAVKWDPKGATVYLQENWRDRCTFLNETNVQCWFMGQEKVE